MKETQPNSQVNPFGVPENLRPNIRYLYDRISDIICVIGADGKFLLVNPSFERHFGFLNHEIQGTEMGSLVLGVDLESFSNLFSQVLEEPDQSQSFDIRLRDKNGDFRDLVGRITNHNSNSEVNGILLIASDTTEQRRWETILGQYSHRLEVLRKIQIGILQAESSQSISKAALDHINSIIPCSLASITLFDMENNNIHLLATMGDDSAPPDLGPMHLIDEIQSVLKQGQWFEINDLDAWEGRSPLFDMMSILLMKRIFFIPLLIRGQLIGSLNLAFQSDGNVRLDHLEAAREVADMLALAIQQSHLLETEQRQRQQAELIRDAISSIATSLNFQQILSDLLASLRLLVSYDSARVVLVEEDSLKVAATCGFPGDLEISGNKHTKENKIFQKMQQHRSPIIIDDVQNEPDFTPWQGQDGIKSWMGVPLVSHNGMIGYLSLNSRKTGAFNHIDLTPVLVFADHVAVTLENAWLYDQTLRRARELSAITRVSSSLRTATNLQELLSTLLEKTLEAVDVRFGFVCHIEKGELILSAAEGPAKRWLGWASPVANNPLLDFLGKNRTVVLGKDLELPVLKAWQKQTRFAGKPANAVFVPLVTTEGMVGLMCLDLEKAGDMDADRRKIIESIGSMASNALYRVLIMGDLENRVSDQTRDLTVLYEVSAITGQALELEDMLSISLDRLLPITNNSHGIIYQLDGSGSVLHRLVERRLPSNPGEESTEPSPLPELIPLNDTAFFTEPLSSGLPHLVEDMRNVANPPPGFFIPKFSTYLGIPIKCKGKILGMLCLFSRADREISIQQMTLLSAIGDQLGVAIDSSRLRRRAADAAVFEERQRLARDLHDSVTQSLYSMTLLAEGYRRQVPNSSRIDIQSWLEDLESVSLQALKEMRLLLYELKPASFQEDGLLDALNRRLQSVESRSGMKVNFSVGPQTYIPPVHQEDLYRIAQEALNNIIKHSGANTVQIRLENRGGDILLEIEDNGKGFIPSEAFNAGGIGLAGMTERTRRLGGSLELQSNIDKGTIVRILVPGGKP
jgi:PAS domain S-box-containing protein